MRKLYAIFYKGTLLTRLPHGRWMLWISSFEKQADQDCGRVEGSLCVDLSRVFTAHFTCLDLATSSYAWPGGEAALLIPWMRL
mmetsp:Transcript_45213/g.96580  ORF Transcript_45213/g.96580 Transcript_45213/m.96580 type:complete len:83 (-) Transcript_45213:392-640(-)